MYVLDVNVLVAAHRDDHVHHAPVDRWFRTMIAGVEPFAVPSLVWTSFLRLVTGRHVFSPSTPPAAAFAFADGICAQPHYLPIEPGPTHLRLLRRLCDEAGATGNLVPDAALAAIALEHDGTIVSIDRDFARFTSIDHVVPGRD
ncbi:MAG: type II toxin-antitoxin system VapC family toxin [Solirubrobacteraceae bacterium]|nr:type II toxin-antitoxin system VapC family toxin [Solirubrobacteraceae bacterium]